MILDTTNANRGGVDMPDPLPKVTGDTREQEIGSANEKFSTAGKQQHNRYLKDYFVE